MRTFQQIAAAPLPVRPFPPGPARDEWARRWCDQCANAGGCPILAVVDTFNRTPIEWTRPVLGGADLECSEFDPAS